MSRTSGRFAALLALAASAGCDPTRPGAPAPEPAAAPAVVAPPVAPKPAVPKPPEAKPAAKPPAPRDPVLARWAVATATVDGREDGWATAPKGVAVNDAGTRVVVRTTRLVDVWEKGRGAALRIQPKGLSQAFVAPDASRLYVVADDATELETWDPAGRRVGAWQPPRPKGARPRFEGGGFDPATGRLVVGVRVPSGEGFYEVSPADGAGRLAVPTPDGLDCYASRVLFPLPGGGLLVNYAGDPGAKRPHGVYAVSAAGAFAPVLAAAEASKQGVIHQMSASADGRHFALVADGGVLKVWDRRSGACVLDWAAQYYHPYAAHFGGGRLLVAAGSRYEKWTTNGLGAVQGVSALPAVLHLYDVPSLRKLGEFTPREHKLPVRALALSPDGSKLALADDKAVAVADVAAAFGLDR